MTLLGEPRGVVGVRETAWARCGRPTGLPAALRSSSGAGSTSKPSSRARSAMASARALAVGARVAQALAAARCGGRSRSRARAGPRTGRPRPRSRWRAPRARRGGPAASASSTPSTVSWSERASSSTPASAAFATTSATGESSTVGVQGVRLEVESGRAHPRKGTKSLGREPCAARDPRRGRRRRGRPRRMIIVPMIAPIRPPRSKICASPMPSSSVKTKKPTQRTGQPQQDGDEEAAGVLARQEGFGDVAGQRARG